MRRFMTYWTLTFLLFLPSWGLTAWRGMASPIDLVWTAALAGTLAGLATLGHLPKTAEPMGRDSSQPR